jgi:hypothetical protein
MRDTEDNTYYNFRQVYDMSKLLNYGVFAILCILIILTAGCTSQQNKQPVQPAVTPSVTVVSPDVDALNRTFLSTPQAPLSDSEKQDIVYLQESEKLERDLYARFAQQYTSVPLFASLGKAATVYMVADDVILQRYNIPDPEQGLQGKFSDQKLQALYNNWADSGSISVMNALTACATSEDMHIADLEAAIGRTDNDDLKFIYRQQLVFSRNNLRALVQWITSFGGTFSPTYLSKDYYNALINSPMEQMPIL